ncbi:hypothetical protein ACFL5B_00475 [Candidatus Latescibacterota bacterium]
MDNENTVFFITCFIIGILLMFSNLILKNVYKYKGEDRKKGVFEKSYEEFSKRGMTFVIGILLFLAVLSLVLLVFQFTL